VGHEAEDGISMDALMRTMAAFPNRYLTVLVDACHSGMLMEAALRAMKASAASPAAWWPSPFPRVRTIWRSTRGPWPVYRRVMHALATTEDDRVFARAPAADVVRELRESIRLETGGWQQPQSLQFGDPSCPSRFAAGER